MWVLETKRPVGLIGSPLLTCANQGHKTKAGTESEKGRRVAPFLVISVLPTPQDLQDANATNLT